MPVLNVSLKERISHSVTLVQKVCTMIWSTLNVKLVPITIATVLLVTKTTVKYVNHTEFHQHVTVKVVMLILMEFVSIVPITVKTVMDLEPIVLHAKVT